jgi:phosphodiester glycosidase
VKRWVLLGLVCAAYFSGLCFLLPLGTAMRAGGASCTLVPPRGGGDGVVVRHLAYGLCRVHVIDADLRTPGVSVRIHARHPAGRRWGWAIGDALSVEEWCRSTGAVGGINGGFFGAEVVPGRKEVIGLLRVGGRTFARAPLYRARHNRSLTYAHSTFGVVDGRQPVMDWVVSDRHSMERLLAYSSPENLRAGRPWRSDYALSGGPRLVHEGRAFVAARHERLASAGALPRTFVGYSHGHGRARNRLVLCTATAMTYDQAAAFVMKYFREQYHEPCDEAMCLDGGPSSQLAYRSGDRVSLAAGGATTVPTCILVHDDALAAHSAPRPAAPRQADNSEGWRLASDTY